MTAVLAESAVVRAHRLVSLGLGGFGIAVLEASHHSGQFMMAW